MSEIPNPVTISPEAVKALKNIILQLPPPAASESEAAPEEVALRLFVSGGGCSGIQYGMTLEAGEAEPDDTCFTQDDISIRIQSACLTYLEGSSVEWTEGEGVNDGGFRIENSQSSAGGCGGCGSGGCGCG